MSAPQPSSPRVDSRPRHIPSAGLDFEYSKGFVTVFKNGDWLLDIPAKTYEEQSDAAFKYLEEHSR